MADDATRANVMITGASAGVGRALARRFAREDGACIGLIARGRERLEETAEEVRTLGGTPVVLPGDVADWAFVDGAAETMEREHGPIDVWVNCAMATMLSPFHEMEADEFRRVTEVTYLGCVHGTLAALRRMRGRDRGTIVQAGSALAYRSIPLQSAYCGAKSGIRAFTDSIRSELIHDSSNVQISVVHLPALNTPQFAWMRNRMPKRPQPLPPIYQPEVAAEAIHFCAHNPRREMWVGRSSIMTILGQKAAPALLDRMLASSGYTGQQTDEPASGGPDNLFEPAPGTHAAHGPFDDRATLWSPALEASEHRGAVGLGGLALGMAFLVGVGLASRGR